MFPSIKTVNGRFFKPLIFAALFANEVIFDMSVSIKMENLRKIKKKDNLRKSLFLTKRQYSKKYIKFK